MPLTLETLKELVIAPHAVLPKVAKARNSREAVVILTLNWIILSVAFTVIIKNPAIIPAVIVAGIIVTLAASFFLHLALTIISGKKDFSGVLVAVTYPFFGLAFSSLLISLFFLWSELFAMLLGSLLLTLYSLVAITGAYRVIKETHKLDVITIWIAMALVILSIFMGIYLVAAIYGLKSGVFIPLSGKLIPPPATFPY